MSNQVVPRQVTDPADGSPCPVCWWHIGIGVLIALLGGVIYAAIAWIVSMIPSKQDPNAIP
jgi:hypothetical protein